MSELFWGLRAAARSKAVIGLALLGIAVVWLVRPEPGGDTGPLQAGTEALASCLRAGDLVACTTHGQIDPFPALQHVPDLIGHATGLSLDDRARLLALLSAVGLAAAVAAAWVVLRRVGCREWRWVFLLAVATGPALAYGNTTWGEMLATGLLTLFVATAVLPARPALVGLAAFGASLTKETGYPFVVALGLVALLLARRRTGEPIRRHLLLGLAGMTLALAANSMLNLIRFGTPRNAYYLDPGLRTTGIDQFLENVAGLVIAPNGGLLVFWPLATLVIALLLALPLVRAVRGVSPWLEAWPALALLAVVGGVVVLLAAWWAPFGWWAWGPRLSLPWVLPILLLAIAAFGSMLTPFAARALAPVSRLIVAAALVIIAALPHVGLLWRPETIGDFFFRTTTAVCPGGGPPPTPASDACLHEEMWTRHPILLDALAGVQAPGGAVTAILVGVVAGGCLVCFRRELATQYAPRPVSTAGTVRAMIETSDQIDQFSM